MLRGALAQAQARCGHTVLMTGEPGIGKTRTAREFTGHAVREGALVLWGRCHEEVGAPPYWPWVQIIGSALAARDPSQALADLGAGAADLADIVPQICDRLPELRPPDRHQDPAEARFLMFEAIRQFFGHACERQAIVLVLDDLHWADAPSLRLLEFLVPEIAELALLVVGTYRATELSRQHPLSNTLGSLTRVPHVVRINLPGLGAEEVQTFIAEAAGSMPPHRFARTLHRQTEGNPLFLREIVRFLEQQGVLSAGLSAPENVLPPVIRIPEGLKEVIGRRLNFLSPACNEILALASVIGREFTHDVLSRAAGPLAQDPLFEALDEALATHVIDEIGAGRYQFAHTLVRMTLYDELRVGQRLRLHRAVGTAIEALSGADRDSVLAELAHHFRAAGDLDRGLDYAVRAGERADALLAFEDAAQSFQVALDALDQRTPADEALRCRLLFRLGDAQRKSGDFQHARDTLHTAVEGARQLGLRDTLAGAALAYEQVCWRTERRVDAPPEGALAEALMLVPQTDRRGRVELTAALARSLLYAGAERQAREYLARAITMARDLADPALLATTLEHLFDFPSGPDKTEELLALATESLEAAEQSGNAEVVCVSRTRRIVCCLELGEFEAAEKEMTTLSRDQARIRQPDYAISLLGFRAMLALMRGDLAAADRLLVEASARTSRAGASQLAYLSVLIFSLRREQGRLREVGPVLAQFMQTASAPAIWGPGLAVLYVELGRLDEARDEFERLAAREFADLPRDGRWTMCMAYLAEVCAALDDAGRAASLYRLLLPYSGRVLLLGGGVVCAGSASRHLGLLATTMADWEAADRHFEEALGMNRRIGALLLLARTQHDYATMLQLRNGRGDRERAAFLLRSSLECAQELGLQALEEHAAARLAQLDNPTAEARAAGVLDDLTPREVEVLRLVAIGRSNADISTALAISLNTVASHVRSILAKTECANRTEAAAYAMRHHLTPQHRG